MEFNPTKKLCPIGSKDITESTDIILEDGPRICPLCSTILKFYFINLKEKVLLCENPFCDFPFGYEKLTFTKVNLDSNCDDEVSSSNSRSSMLSPTGSTISSSVWADIEKMNRACDSEDSNVEERCITSKDNEKSPTKTGKEDEEMEAKLNKDINNIKQLNVALAESEKEPQFIKNEKWLRNLMKIQELTGVKLLHKEELQKAKKKDMQLGQGELKIDYTSSDNSVPSVKIELKTKGTKSK